LTHLLLIVILPITVGIFGVKVILVGWEEWRDNSAIVKAVPIKVLKPNMLLDLLGAVQTKAVNRLTLYKFVDEVCCFKAPPGRDFIFPDLYLLR
jgi:hypothetical protein